MINRKIMLIYTSNKVYENLNTIKKIISFDPLKNSRVFKNYTIVINFQSLMESFEDFLDEVLRYELIPAGPLREILSECYRNKIIDQRKTWMAILNDRTNLSDYKGDSKTIKNIKKNVIFLEVTYQKIISKYDFILNNNRISK